MTSLWEVKGSQFWDPFRCVTWSFLVSIWTWRALRLSPQWLPRGMECADRQTIRKDPCNQILEQNWESPSEGSATSHCQCFIISKILYILRFDIHISVFSGDSKRLETTRLYGWGPCLNPSTCSFNVPWHWMSGIGIINTNPGYRTTQQRKETGV